MIRQLQKSDIISVMELLNKCKPFVLAHHEYIYRMLSKYHSESSFVYVGSDKIPGFPGALQSIEKSTAFVWQICVDPEHRRKNIGIDLLKELEKLLHDGRIENIQLSITAGNSSSHKLFAAFSGERNLVFEKIESTEISTSVETVYKISKN